MTDIEEDKRQRAQQRVKQIKGFFTHATVYVIINTMLIVVKLVGTTYNGENFMGPIRHFSTLAPPLFWGIGLALHGIKVFRLNPLLNADWEKRQIQKYMKEDQNESEKFK